MNKKKESIRLNSYKNSQRSQLSTKQQTKEEQLIQLLQIKQETIQNAAIQIQFLKQQNKMLKFRLTKISEQNLQDVQKMWQLKEQIQALKTQNRKINTLYYQEKESNNHLKKQFMMQNQRTVFKQININQGARNSNMVGENIQKYEDIKDNKSGLTQYKTCESVNNYNDKIKKVSSNCLSVQVIFQKLLKNLKNKQFALEEIVYLPKIIKFTKIQSPNSKDFLTIFGKYPFQIETNEIQVLQKYSLQQLKNKSELSGDNIWNFIMCRLQRLNLQEIMKEEISENSLSHDSLKQNNDINIMQIQSRVSRINQCNKSTKYNKQLLNYQETPNVSQSYNSPQLLDLIY